MRLTGSTTMRTVTRLAIALVAGGLLLTGLVSAPAADAGAGTVSATAMAPAASAPGNDHIVCDQAVQQSSAASSLARSGDGDLEFPDIEFAIEGDHSNQCGPPMQFGNTGNFPATKAAPAAASTTLPWVKREARGAHVKTIQYLLSHHDADLAIDEVFGRQTEEKVRAFQEDHRLTVDGEVGPRTWGALFATVERGHQGDAVRALHTQLLRPSVQKVINDAIGILQCTGTDTSCGEHARLEAFIDEEDSASFGEQTDRNVRLFQKQRLLVVDGNVGSQTWTALVAEPDR